MKYFQALLAAFTLVLISIQIVISQPTKVVTVEGISEYQLTNGLRALLFPDPSKQTITVNVTYMVGSKHENYGETGMAHLLEHMVFKGTEKHPNIKEEIANRGNRWNGTTWYDRTNYFETLRATEDNLAWAIAMEADRMVNSRITKEDLESEMTVVRNEFEMGENYAYNVLLQRILSTAFLWHNYGKSTIGARSDIENVPIPRLQAFYDKYYQPDNAVLIIAGNFDEAKALSLIQEHFGAIPKPERELPQIYTKDPTQDGERQVVLRRVGDTQLVGVGYHVPAGYHPDFAGVSILTHVLGNEPSGRLHKALVEPGLATRVYGFSYQLAEPGMALFAAEALKENDSQQIKNTLLATIDSLKINPPTDQEVDRARNNILKYITQAFNSSEQICISLSNWIGMGDWRLFFIHRDRIEDITSEQVAEVANRYLKADNRTVGMYIPTDEPDRAEIPEAPPLSDLVDNYQGKEDIASGESFDPTVENIENSTTRFELSNGMQVVLLPKKTRGESVRLSMSLLNGNLESLKNKREISSLTAAMLKRGTENLSRQDIEDKLSELRSTINISGQSYFLIATVETIKENIKPTLDLLAEILQQPSFPEDEFEKLIRERKTNIEFQRSEPNAVAYNALMRHIDPYPADDIRYNPTFDEQISRLESTEIADIKDFHQKFYGSSHGTMAIVGDFELQPVKDQLESLFGNWESQVAFERVKSEIQDVEVFNQKIETPDKKNAFFFGRQEFPFEPDNEDLAALELGFYILGTGFESRLVKRIREKEGISYGVGGNFDAHPTDKIGSFGSYAIYAPENVSKLEEVFLEEINKVIEQGFTEVEIEQGKESWQQRRIVNLRAQDNALARHLSLYLEYGRDLTWDQDLEEAVSELSTEEVNAAMKKYLDPERIHRVMAGDFQGAEVKEGTAVSEQ